MAAAGILQAGKSVRWLGVETGRGIAGTTANTTDATWTTTQGSKIA